MNTQESISLMRSIHPNFFESENLSKMPDGAVFEEMLLPLDEFDCDRYQREFDGSVTFGLYDGDIDSFKKEVEKVDRDWQQFFGENDRILCGFVEGKVACFCLVEDNGTHVINGRKLRIGGPGCVGTLPEYRNKGLGLTMVKLATQLLKDEGFDYSQIHYTGVAAWYAKLGYKTVLRWNKNGILPQE
ncbi:MAG: GNAT family N-acetyltransferase [Oscillospiraceae bacterium]